MTEKNLEKKTAEKILSIMEKSSLEEWDHSGLHNEHLSFNRYNGGPKAHYLAGLKIDRYYISLTNCYMDLYSCGWIHCYSVDVYDTIDRKELFKFEKEDAKKAWEIYRSRKYKHPRQVRDETLNKRIQRLYFFAKEYDKIRSK